MTRGSQRKGLSVDVGYMCSRHHPRDFFIKGASATYFLESGLIDFHILISNQQQSTAITLFFYQFLNYSSVLNYTSINNLLVSGDSVIFLSIFTQKYFLFILISIILLFAMVGSIVLCIQEKNK